MLIQDGYEACIRCGEFFGKSRNGWLILEYPIKSSNSAFFRRVCNKYIRHITLHGALVSIGLHLERYFFYLFILPCCEWKRMIQEFYFLVVSKPICPKCNVYGWKKITIWTVLYFLWLNSMVEIYVILFLSVRRNVSLLIAYRSWDCFGLLCPYFCPYSVRSCFCLIWSKTLSL